MRPWRRPSRAPAAQRGRAQPGPLDGRRRERQPAPQGHELTGGRNDRCERAASTLRHMARKGKSRSVTKRMQDVVRARRTTATAAAS